MYSINCDKVIAVVYVSCAITNNNLMEPVNNQIYVVYFVPCPKIHGYIEWTGSPLT